MSVDFVDYKKFNKERVAEIFCTVNLELTIFKEEIGRLRVNKL